VLEIGAGRGRVIRWLRSHFPKAPVVAIDQSSVELKRVEAELGQGGVTFIESNILTLELKEKASLALWMWSGFAEIAGSEKLAALKNVAQNLRAEGQLVIDLPKEIIGREQIVYEGDGNLELREPFGTLRAHLVSDSKLIEIASHAGFKLGQVVQYET